MGRQRTPSLYAGDRPQPEPGDSRMSELQLQTVALEPAPRSRVLQPSLSRKPKARARPLRIH